MDDGDVYCLLGLPISHLALVGVSIDAFELLFDCSTLMCGRMSVLLWHDVAQNLSAINICRQVFGVECWFWILRTCVCGLVTVSVATA